MGERTVEGAQIFVRDLASRLENRVQLTADGLRLDVNAVESSFAGNIDGAQLIKLYGAPEPVYNERRCSPAACTGHEMCKINGEPDIDQVSNSYVERENLTMRLGDAAVRPAHQRLLRKGR